MKQDRPLELADVESALQYISANTTREQWVKIGMAIKSEFPREDGFATFDRWSATAPDQYSAQGTLSVWKSFSSKGGVGLGSLVYEARRGGWTREFEPWLDQDVPKAVHERVAVGANSAEDEAQALAARTDAMQKAHALWQSAHLEAPAAYLAHKGVQAFGTATTTGGTLLVPLRDVNGQLHNVQRIYNDPSTEEASYIKLYFKGGQKSELFHALGQLEDGKPIALAEGYATAASVHEATGLTTLTTFDAANMVKVAQLIRDKFPNSPMVIAGDDDTAHLQIDGHNPGREKALQAAELVKGVAVFPGDVHGPLLDRDFNDLHKEYGLSQVKAVFEAGLKTLLEPVAPQVSAEVAQPEQATPQVPVQGAIEQQAARPAAEPKQTPPNQVEAAPGAPRKEPEVDDFAQLLDVLRKQYTHVNGKFYFLGEDKKLAFEDRGATIVTDLDSADIARSMMMLSKAKGWESVKIDGSDDFRRAAWLEARLMGLKVQGYEPDAYDLQQLAERQKTALQDSEPLRARLMGNHVSQAEERELQQAAPVQGKARGAKSVQADAELMTHKSVHAPVEQQIWQEVLQQTGSALRASDVLDSLAQDLRRDRVYVGRLLEHGPARYQFNPSNNDSYFVRLSTLDGERVLWGVEFGNVMKEPQAPNLGDLAVLVQHSSDATQARDENGQWILAKRNHWLVQSVNKAAAEFDAGTTQTLIVPVEMQVVHPAIELLKRSLELNRTPADVIEQLVEDLSEHLKPLSHAQSGMPWGNKGITISTADALAAAPSGASSAPATPITASASTAAPTAAPSTAIPTPGM